MEEVGLAVTVGPVVVFNAVAGVQVYVFAPLADRITGCPLHIVCGGETTSTGSGLTVTLTWAVEVHPFRSPVTV